MKNRHTLSTAFVAFVVFLGARQEAPAQPAKSKVSDLIRFDVKAVAEDPFHPANEQKKEGPVPVRRGQLVKIIVTGTPKAGYHTYPLTIRTSSQDPVQLSRMEFAKVPGVAPLWPVAETKPQEHFDKDIGTLLEHAGAFVWQQDVLVTADASPGVLTVPIKLSNQVCNKSFCVPVSQDAKVSLDVSMDEPMPLSPALALRLDTAKPPLEVVAIPGEKAVGPASKPAAKTSSPVTPQKADPTFFEGGLIEDSAAEYKAKMDAIAAQIEVKQGGAQTGNDLLAFMLAGVLWGAISLVTPCVFPMIPITVSFFLKQSEKEHHRPVVLASIYSLTIVIVLTLAAGFLLSAFRLLSVNPITNYFLGGLFIFFALSLFGMYEIELPHSLAQFTSSREGKGGLYGTIFMALTFTIISFACVAPFLGGFSGTAASNRPMSHNLLGGLAFSTTFASPFFLLALFPSLLRKMPKSGSWLNSVKVVMGFLELAAAFKFFRSAELIQTIGAPTLFTFDFVLGIWIALCVLSGLYLIGLFRLPHDSPEQHIGVPRLLFSVAFLGLAIYLTPALFKVNGAGQSQRPMGAIYAWIDSFLLPEFQAGEDEVPHTANLDYAIFTAREEQKKTGRPQRIFVDFTGVTCTNCIKNERNVFSRPAIVQLFAPYLVVKLYTDIVPARYYGSRIQAERTANASRAEIDAKDVNLAFQKNNFNGEQLPLYAILEADGQNHIRVVATYEEGLINDVPGFAKFLKNPDAYQH